MGCLGPRESPRKIGLVWLSFITIIHPLGKRLMTNKDIHLEIRDSVAIVRLSRPAKRNALSDGLVLGLRNVFETFPDTVRAAVLDGEGEHFCAGLDLSELK